MSAENISKVAPYAESFGLTFPVAAGSPTGGALGSLVGKKSIPHSFLIDPTGKLAWHGHPSALSSKTVASVLRGATKPGKKDAISWRGHVDGAPPEAITSAAKGDLAKALGILGKKESAGATQLKAELETHIEAMASQIEAGLERKDVPRSLAYLELLSGELKGHPLGAPLRARLDEARKDDGVMAELDAHDALDRALELGRKRGMKKAHKTLERLIDKFPGTKAAERASKLLGKS